MLRLHNEDIALHTQSSLEEVVIVPAPKTAMGREEFEVLVRVSGLPLSDEQKAELHGAYGYIEAMAKRVRTEDARPRENEPAMVFRPTVGKVGKP